MTDDIWQEAIGLTRKVFAATSVTSLPTNDDWHVVAGVHLYQAYQRLDSISMLLVRGYRDSADILTRSLFEIAVNLSYIAKDVEQRLPEYLRHGHFPLSKEEAEQIGRKLSQEPSPEVNGIVPNRAWKPLRVMCCDLGWLAEYNTFYRYLSVVDHAGSFRLLVNYLRLLEQEPLSQWDKASVLIAALCLYLRVAEVAATVFPAQIKAEGIAELTAECNKMSQFFAQS